MELRPHDLLKISSHHDIKSDTPLPEWAKESLSVSPFVVVRRAIAAEGQVAVGIRGENRSERFGAFLPIDFILERITPEQLSAEQSWKNDDRHKKVELFSTLDDIAEFMDDYSINWGPTGSVGFELVTGREVVTDKSDIDIVIRSPIKMPINIAKNINHYFVKGNIKVDAQVETQLGAFSLIEYATEASPILMRTMTGPVLLKDPWIYK